MMRWVRGAVLCALWSGLQIDWLEAVECDHIIATAKVQSEEFIRLLENSGDPLSSCLWSFSHAGTGRQLYVQEFVWSETTNCSALGAAGSIDLLTSVAIDVDRVKDDDTIGNERRVPLDAYSSGVQCFQIHIPRCISRSYKRVIILM